MKDTYYSIIFIVNNRNGGKNKQIKPLCYVEVILKIYIFIPENNLMINENPGRKKKKTGHDILRTVTHKILLFYKHTYVYIELENVPEVIDKTDNSISGVNSSDELI